MSLDLVALSDLLKLFFDSVIGKFESIKVFLRGFNEFYGRLVTLGFFKENDYNLII